jgi:protein AroM
MRNKLRLGIVTVGQTPREDLTENVRHIGNSDVDIVIYGALDGFTEAEIRNIALKEGDFVVEAKLANGSSRKIPKRFVSPMIKNCVHRLKSEDVDAIIVACGVEFRGLEADRPIIKPWLLLSRVVSVLLSKGILGVIVPIAEQVAYAKSKWSRKERCVHIEVASPWSKKELDRAARKIRDANVDLIVLDGYGYGKSIKEKVRKVTGKPVLAPSTLAVSLVRELFG